MMPDFANPWKLCYQLTTLSISSCIFNSTVKFLLAQNAKFAKISGTFSSGSIAFFKSIFNLGSVFRRFQIKTLRISMLNSMWQGVPLSTYPKNDILIPLFVTVVITSKQAFNDEPLRPSLPCPPIGPLLPALIQD